jgi:hypothetical protein
MYMCTQNTLHNANVCVNQRERKRERERESVCTKFKPHCVITCTHHWPGTSGGFSPGAGTRQAELKVHVLPLTDARISPVEKTFVTRPAWPRVCKKNKTNIQLIQTEKEKERGGGGRRGSHKPTSAMSSTHPPWFSWRSCTLAMSSMTRTTSPTENCSACRMVYYKACPLINFPVTLTPTTDTESEFIVHTRLLGYRTRRSPESRIVCTVPTFERTWK